MSKIEKSNKVLKKTNNLEVVTRMVSFTKNVENICYDNFYTFLQNVYFRFFMLLKKSTNNNIKNDTK
jgi:hypothetical protein